MSREKLLTVAVIGLLLLNLSMVGFLYLRKPPHERMGPAPFAQREPKNRIVEVLHFDAQQVSDYEKLIVQHRQAIRHLNDQIYETKGLLYQSISRESGVGKDSLIQTLGSLQMQIETTHYNHFKHIQALCRPDQLIHFDTLSSQLANFFTPEGRQRGRPE